MSEQANNAVLSAHIIEEIDHALAKYPAEQKRSAVLAALHAVQHEHGHLSNELMDAVAAKLEIEPIKVYEVATFYSMFETKEVGRNSISVCTNISCMLRGADEIVEHIENKLGIKTGQSSEDGKWHMKCEEECLAACRNAPMMMVNHKYYENLTTDKVDEILDELD
ncbi:MAG: NAD(P)H-dependent oxidoreductase subunit E [Gammaproteobacteria bacterium]|nr:NAD(P)H-dependent oxidoreductase subunit E [Gammaproteobacteria bacterium]